MSSNRRRGAVSRRTVPAATAALALMVLPAAQAHAGVEYVTPTSNCTDRLADMSQHQTLTVMSGTVTFEVWGNSVDLTSKSGFAFNGPPGSSASMTTQRNGAQNQARGCGFVGSAVVTVTVPGTITADVNANLSFTMPLGDKSILPMTFRAMPVISTTWTTNGALKPTAMPCIVGTGTITSQNQDAQLVIQLPAGHRQDQSTCTSNVINLTIKPTVVGALNVPGPNITYNVSGLPSFVTAAQAVAVHPFVPATIALTFNVAGIRAISTASNSTITITNGIASNRKTTLTLQVLPNLGQGFAQIASANPATSVVGNPIDFTVTLSAPASSGPVTPSGSPKQQAIEGRATVITWRMTTASCFTQALPQAPYNANSPFQYFVFPAGQTSANIRVRSVNGGGCTDQNHPVTHIFEAWIGDNRVDPQVTAVSSGPNYTKTNISLNFQ
jgi:hypothetical protein